MADISWKFEYAAREHAIQKGEELADANGFVTYPVDPFVILRHERQLIHAEGADFGDAFDGRLSYIGPRFLLCYNTRYNVWPKRGPHHPKVRFTIAHELGHYYLENHRRYLVQEKKPHGSLSEFESHSRVEREADCFASGLLMPKRLLGPRVNCELDATVDTIKAAATDFDVSLTGMMVRWTQVSHFPCATLCIRGGTIQWGFVSEAFRSAGFRRARRNQKPTSRQGSAFLATHSNQMRYAEGTGRGLSTDWIDSDGIRVPVDEFYVVIPYSQCVLVFLTADEDELPKRWHDEDE